MIDLLNERGSTMKVTYSQLSDDSKKPDTTKPNFIFRLLKFFFRLSLLSVLVLLAIITFNVLTLPSPVKVPPCSSNESHFVAADEAVLERFRAGLRWHTVSYGPGVKNVTAIESLVQHIIKSYPAIHTSSIVSWKRVANYSLLYKISAGQSEQSSTLKPYLLMAHLDVVPADPDQWEWPPFSAEISGEFIYGRGTIDDKHMVFGILEALETLLKTDFQPKRTFYVAFGHDEEIAGFEGAQEIGKLLEQDGVSLEFILDEGLVILDGVTPGMDKPVAFIGTSEKGSLTIQLSVNITGGHSSMPAGESSIGILARAITRLEDNPHKSMFGRGPESASLLHLAPYMSISYRILLSNMWLFGPIISKIMSAKPSTNAQIRTTTAVTMFNAGVKENVLASYAEAVVNHRIHPSQSVDEVLRYDKEVVRDERVKIKVLSSMEPHPISPDQGFGYDVISQSIREVFSTSTVAPGLMIGNTDTRHYLSLTKNVYRFAPSIMKENDLLRFHGVNERISVKNYEQAINFYIHVILNADNDSMPPKDHRHDSL